MVAVKATDVDAFVARPDPARRVVLVFGPDAGLAGERVRALLAASVDDINDPFADQTGIRPEHQDHAPRRIGPRHEGIDIGGFDGNHATSGIRK